MNLSGAILISIPSKQSSLPQVRAVAEVREIEKCLDQGILGWNDLVRVEDLGEQKVYDDFYFMTRITPDSAGQPISKHLAGLEGFRADSRYMERAQAQERIKELDAQIARAQEGIRYWQRVMDDWKGPRFWEGSV